MSLNRSQIIPFPHPFLIQASAELPFLNAMQHMIDEMIPASYWNSIESEKDIETLLYRLHASLPLFKQTEIAEGCDSLAFSYLCPADYTYQARRFVMDTLSRWLIPGKSVEIAGGMSLFFEFAHAPNLKFFAAQDLVFIRSREEQIAIRKNLPDLITQLQKKLPCEFTRQSEYTIHPIFMPRNEEDTFRNLIVIASQIKFIRDLPQVSIHYEKQTDMELIFTVILARVQKGPSLRKYLEKSRLKMEIDDVRTMGHVKQKYPKETAILRITLNKRPFFRADYSLDLLRARQKIVLGLTECLGEIRDFNGGMIGKQDEALTQLRQEIGKLSREQEFVLETFFYSLKPIVMQTVHDTFLLKKHFSLLETVLRADFRLQPYKVLSTRSGKFLLLFISGVSSSFKPLILEAISPLGISSRNLTSSCLEIKNISALGFILRLEADLGEKFTDAIDRTLREWSRRFHCILK